MELHVKQVHDGLAVSVAQYAMYLSFGRELWSLTRKEVSGETAAEEASPCRARLVGLARDLARAFVRPHP
jgi:hypothetical protein